MEKTVIYCDICGKPDASPFSFAVNSQMDAAGDRDTIHERVDLCPACCANQIALFIAALPWSAREKMAKDIRKDKRLYVPAKL